MTISTLNFFKRAILAMAPFIFIACEKPNEQLGLNQVIGEQAGLADTSLNVISYTENVDSIPVALSYNSQLVLGGYGGNRMAGAYVDPYFGRAEAAFVSQMIPGTVNFDFGDNPVVDSVRLYMRYSGSYGDTSVPMTFEVYELEEALSRDSIYYSSFEPVLGEKLGEKSSVTPEPNTIVFIEGVKTTPTLTISLETAYFQQNFAAKADGSFPAFSTDEAFIEYFKGIVVKASATDGSIVYFDLGSANSGLKIYYSNDVEDSLSFSLRFTQQQTPLPIHFNIFEQDYQSYPTGFDLTIIDSINGESTTYVQAMGGVFTVLEIEGLADLQKNGLLVNRAVLEIPKQSGTGSALAPPPRLEIREFTSEGPGSAIRDFAIFTNSTGDGVYRSEEFRQGFYRFDISRYVFDVLNGGENKKLAVWPTTRSTAANRVILKGGNNTDKPVQLKIYYSKP